MEDVMKKVITISEFTEELISRIEKDKTVDCCREEIKKFARLAKEKMGKETIEVNWKEN